MRLVYASRARQDISEIYDNIALHNASAAQRVEDFIRRTCENLTQFPAAHPMTDVPNVRRAPLGRYPYTIFFRIDPVRDVVEIARVVHGARVRDLCRLPDDDGD